MKAFWITFEDGSKGCCEGQSAGDAMRIAEHVTAKKVAAHDEYQYSADKNPNIQPLPYPASERIWSFDHPVYGKTPSFCFKPDECCGKSSCPQNYSCTE